MATEQAFEQVEREWAAWNELDPAGMVGCSSGTAALHLGLEVLRGDCVPGLDLKVVVPDLTMVACARAVTLAGMAPTFVDCGDDLLIDLDAMEDLARDDRENLWGLGVAAMAVHVYGRSPDMDRLSRIALDVGMDVVEDLAEAHGVRPHPRSAVACWSFYRNKIVAGEEGGAVWFADPAHAALARQLRSLGFTAAHDFDHVPRGHNYRLSNLHAGAILPGIRNARQALRDRRQIEEWHEEWCPEEWKMRRRDVVWVYDLRVPGMTADVQGEVVRELNLAGIAARHCFKPMSSLREYRECGLTMAGNRGHVAGRIASEVLYLPTVPGATTRESVRAAFGIIKGVVGRRRTRDPLPALPPLPEQQ